MVGGYKSMTVGGLETLRMVIDGGKVRGWAFRVDWGGLLVCACSGLAKMPTAC